MRQLLIGFWVSTWVALSAIAAEAPAELTDIYGANHFDTEFKDENTKATVYIVLDDKCPVVQKAIPDIIRLYKQYNSFERDRAGRPLKGGKYAGDPVRFLGIYVKPGLESKAMAAHALEKRLPFRVLHDSNLELVKKLGITRLSEVVVVNRDGKIQYQGPVNDQLVAGSSKPKATQYYLSYALEDVMAGRPVKQARVPAVGCKIDLEPRARITEGLTYYKDVAPIIQARCQKCHREGEVGPMTFTSYDDVVAYSSMVEEVVLNERMPPWPAVSSRKFHKPEQLTKQERETLLAWLSGDQPAGDPATAPEPVEWADATEWKIGKPDFVFEMKEPVEVPATGVIDYVYVPIAVNGGKGFPEDRWIEAIETHPGAPEVVHHIQIQEYFGPVDKPLTPLDQIMMYGLSIESVRLLGSYTPGNAEENARQYNRYLNPGSPAKSAGMKLSRGANLVLEMHYTPNGTKTFDKSSVAIRFAKQKPDMVLETWFPFRKRMDMIIPANVENHSLQDIYHFGSHTGGKAVLVHGIRPHLHTRGKNYRLELVNPKGLTPSVLADYKQHDTERGETLLGLPVWDFSWQHLYRFEEPILVTPDKALLATAYWDNTIHNPRNPDATQDVPWGQQTEQEMFNTLFIYEVLEPGDPRLGGK